MILLDTNVLLWLFAGDKRLSPDSQHSIEQNPADYVVSIVSLWEIATKRAIGKLELAMDVPKAVLDAGFFSLSLTHTHIYQYELLPLIHRDPFDRMLIAQALTENVPLLTADNFLEAYNAKIISAEA